MRRDPRAYLWDVREASSRIAEFVNGISLEEFCVLAALGPPLDA